MKITSDFDGTIRSYDGNPIDKIIKMLKSDMIDNNISIITKRSYDETHAGLDGEGVINFVKENIGDIPVHFTNGKYKWNYLKNNNVDLHYDDDDNEIKLINDNTDIQTIKVDYDKSVERQEALLYKNSEAEKRDKYTICIVDNPGGSYFNTAQLLSPYFKKTYYHTPNISAFPHPALSKIGIGYLDIERVDDFWSNVDNFDIIIFPDMGFIDWGRKLRQMGKMVWGASEAELLETSRSLFECKIKEVGLPLAPSEVIIGLDNLKDYLENKENVWIKISKWRNIAETYNWVDYTRSKFWLDDLTTKVGPIDDIEFIVQEPIDSIAELGTDGYVVNGKYPSNVAWGIEVKDVGYVGKTFDELPDPLKEVNEKFEKVLIEYEANGAYSTEIRYSEDKTPYFTDICVRNGMPPSSSVMYNIKNWSDIIPAACKGEMVEPIYKSKYMFEIILKSNYASHGFLPVTFPPEYENNITLKGAMKREGEVFIIPFELSGVEMTEFGSVVVNGDDLDKCVEKALMICDEIKTYELRYEVSAMDLARESIDRLEKSIGIRF